MSLTTGNKILCLGVKRGVQAHRRHKKILKQAKGYYGARSRVFRVAKQAVIKAGQYAYRDRASAQAPIPCSMDYSDQCRRTAKWPILQSLYGWTKEINGGP